MSVLVKRSPPIIFQRFTGSLGTLHSERLPPVGKHEVTRTQPSLLRG